MKKVCGHDCNAKPIKFGSIVFSERIPKKRKPVKRGIDWGRIKIKVNKKYALAH